MLLGSVTTARVIQSASQTARVRNGRPKYAHNWSVTKQLLAQQAAALNLHNEQEVKMRSHPHFHLSLRTHRNISTLNSPKG